MRERNFDSLRTQQVAIPSSSSHVRPNGIATVIASCYDDAVSLVIQLGLWKCSLYSLRSSNCSISQSWAVVYTKFYLFSYIRLTASQRGSLSASEVGSLISGEAASERLHPREYWLGDLSMIKCIISSLVAVLRCIVLGSR
jgi:hypothetical protein